MPSIKQNTDGSVGIQGAGMATADGGFVVVTMPYGTASVDCPYFIPHRKYIVKHIALIPKVLDGAATTVSVKWVADGSAINTGTKPHSGTGDLNANANTIQTLTLSSTASDLIIDAGYSIGLDFSGALTNGVGVVSMTLCPA